MSSPSAAASRPLLSSSSSTQRLPHAHARTTVDAITPSNPPRPSKWWVLPIIFTQMLNYGIIRPSIPTLELAFFNNSYSLVSLIAGVSDASGAILSFFCMPILGAYSDRHGRRPILLLTLFFTSLPVLTLSLYPTYFTSLWPFFATQIVTKLSTYSSVYSYVADVTEPAERSAAYGQVSATVFFALTLGPVIASQTSMQGGFVVASVLSIVNMCYCAWIMPESHGVTEVADVVQSQSSASGASSSTTTSTTSTAHPAHVIPHRRSHALSPLLAVRFVRSHPVYGVLFSMVLWEHFGSYGINEILLLYLMSAVGFTREDNIQFLFVGGIVSCFCMLVVLPWISRILGERRLIIVCIILYLTFTLLYPFVTTKSQVYAIMLLSAVSGMTFPATSTLLSVYVPPEDIGIAQGTLSAVRNLALGIGPLVFSILFAYFIRPDVPVHFPAAPFLLAAALTAFSLVFALRLPSTGPEAMLSSSSSKDEHAYEPIAECTDEVVEEDEEEMKKNGGDRV